MIIQVFQLQVLKEILDLLVLQVQLVHRENKVLLVLQDPLDHKVNKVYKAYKVSKVLLAQLVLKEKLDLLALLVLKEIRVKLENKDLKVFKVL